MSKATFLVKVMHRGREADYRAFWVRGEKKNAAGETLHSALVGFLVSVDATSKDEAHAQVRVLHPGLSLDTEATERFT